MATLDLSSDYAIWDDPKAIQMEVRDLTRNFHTASGDLYDVTVAKRRAVNWKELTASGGAYTGRDTVWIIPQAVLPDGRVPKVGDVVIGDDSIRYTCLEVAPLGKWGQTWRLVTRNLVLANLLSDTIHIQRADVGYDAAGAAVRAFPPDGGSTIYASLKARVQLTDQTETDERGVRGMKELYQVIVEKDVQLQDEDRIYWTAKGGIYLDIKRYTQADRIDVLPIIECERPL